MDHADHDCCHTETAEIAALPPNYTPLILILGWILLVSLAIAWRSGEWMGAFMGIFFLTFALFKGLSWRDFADGFARYDLLAARSRAYALAYPAIEAALGVGCLVAPHSKFLNAVIFALMAFGAAGVVRGMRKGIVQCACLGAALNVPLSTVSVLENAGMAGMALWALMAG